MSWEDEFAQRQRDELRGTSMGRRITAAPIERDWPDVPKHRAAPCDRCERDAEPGSALCNTCANQHLQTEKDTQ